MQKYRLEPLRNDEWDPLWWLKTQLLFAPCKPASEHTEERIYLLSVGSQGADCYVSCSAQYISTQKRSCVKAHLFADACIVVSSNHSVVTSPLFLLLKSILSNLLHVGIFNNFLITHGIIGWIHVCAHKCRHTHTHMQTHTPTHTWHTRRKLLKY